MDWAHWTLIGLIGVTIAIPVVGFIVMARILRKPGKPIPLAWSSWASPAPHSETISFRALGDCHVSDSSEV